MTNFRFLFRELSDKILVPTVAGITANSYAVTLAHECGLRVAFAGRAESLGGCAVFALHSARKIAANEIADFWGFSVFYRHFLRRFLTQGFCFFWTSAHLQWLGGYFTVIR